MNEILYKLKSRKLWLAIAGVAAGIALAFGVDASDIQTVAGAVTTVLSVAVYIVMEGKVDAEAVKQAIIGIEGAVEVIEDEPHE